MVAKTTVTPHEPAPETSHPGLAEPSPVERFADIKGADIKSPSGAMARNVGGFTHDLTALAELQIKLLKADLREMLTRMVVPLLLGAIGGLFFLAFLVTLLEGIAYWLETLPMSRAAGFLVSAGVGLVAAVLLALIAWFRLRRSFEVIQRSQKELANNLNWLRVVLGSPLK